MVQSADDTGVIFPDEKNKPKTRQFGRKDQTEIHLVYEKSKLF